MGRPTEYRLAYADLAFKFCLLGATDKQLANFFGVSEQTVNAWKKKHPKFLESIQRGKLKADAEIAESLYHRAKGYSHPEDKVFQYQGNPIVVPTTKHYPPDTQAASLWLRNRQPEKWRDKQELEHHHVEPVTINIVTGIDSDAPGSGVDDQPEQEAALGPVENPADLGPLTLKRVSVEL